MSERPTASIPLQRREAVRGRYLQTLLNEFLGRFLQLVDGFEAVAVQRVVEANGDQVQQPIRGQALLLHVVRVSQRVMEPVRCLHRNKAILFVPIKLIDLSISSTFP